MRNKTIFPLFLTAIGVTLILMACGNRTQLAGNPVRGGQLYDKWWVVIGVEVPAGDQPLWATQTTNTRSDGDT